MDLVEQFALYPSAMFRALSLRQRLPQALGRLMLLHLLHRSSISSHINRVHNRQRTSHRTRTRERSRSARSPESSSRSSSRLKVSSPSAWNESSTPPASGTTLQRTPPNRVRGSWRRTAQLLKHQPFARLSHDVANLLLLCQRAQSPTVLWRILFVITIPVLGSHSVFGIRRLSPIPEDEPPGAPPPTAA